MFFFPSSTLHQYFISFGVNTERRNRRSCKEAGKSFLYYTTQHTTTNKHKIIYTEYLCWFRLCTLWGTASCHQRDHFFNLTSECKTFVYLSKTHLIRNCHGLRFLCSHRSRHPSLLFPFFKSLHIFWALWKVSLFLLSVTSADLRLRSQRKEISSLSSKDNAA